MVAGRAEPRVVVAGVLLRLGAVSLVRLRLRVGAWVACRHEARAQVVVLAPAFRCLVRVVFMSWSSGSFLIRIRLIRSEILTPP